jgi:hypothetical protein
VHPTTECEWATIAARYIHDVWVRVALWIAITGSTKHKDRLPSTSKRKFVWQL